MWLTRLVGIFAVGFGVLFLLYLFMWATIQPPGLAGWAWWASVLRTMFCEGCIYGTVLGLTCLASGAFLTLQRSGRRPSIFSWIVMLTVAAMLLLGVALS